MCISKSSLHLLTTTVHGGLFLWLSVGPCALVRTLHCTRRLFICDRRLARTFAAGVDGLYVWYSTVFLGYISYDFVLMLVYRAELRPSAVMYFHHVITWMACICCMLFGNFQSLNARLMLAEASTPFLNLHWFLRRLKPAPSAPAPPRPLQQHAPPQREELADAIDRVDSIASPSPPPHLEAAAAGGARRRAGDSDNSHSGPAPQNYPKGFLTDAIDAFLSRTVRLPFRVRGWNEASVHSVLAAVNVAIFMSLFFVCRVLMGVVMWHFTMFDPERESAAWWKELILKSLVNLFVGLNIMWGATLVRILLREIALISPPPAPAK